jgi:hypothetical protein
LKTVTSPATGSVGGPNPVTAVSVPEPTLLPGGQAAAGPCARISSLVAVQRSTAAVSMRVPGGRRNTALAIAGGLPFGSSGFR